MPTFRKILVPVDFSPHSGEATRVAAELSRAFDAPLTVMTAFQSPVYPLPEGAFVASPRMLADAMEATQKLLEQSAAQATACGATRVETKLVDGAPFKEIVSFARAGDYDLIVMGTHGRTGLKHALLGSVAEKVVRKAPCAVLTVRMPGHKFEHP